MSRRARRVGIHREANIVCLTRNIFNQDLEALSRFGTWHLQRISRSQQRWVVADIRSDLRSQGTFLLKSQDRIADFKEARKRVDELLDASSTRGILTANFSYFQDEPFRQWAQDHEVPFIVLAKEHSLSKSREQMAAAQSEFHPKPERLATAAFVAGAVSIAYADAGLVPHEHVHVTGLPRFDTYRFGCEWSEARTPRNHLLVLDSGSGYGRPGWNIQSIRRSAALAGWSIALRPRPAHVLRPLDRIRTVAPRWASRIGTVPLDRSPSFSNGLSRAGAVLGPGSIALYETLLTDRPILVMGDDDKNPLVRHAGDTAGIIALDSIKDLVGVLKAVRNRRTAIRFDKELRYEIFREKLYLDAKPSSHIISSILRDYARQ